MLPNTYVTTGVICMHISYKFVHHIANYSSIRPIIIMFTYVANTNGWLTNAYLYKSYYGIYVSGIYLHNNTSLESNTLPFHIQHHWNLVSEVADNGCS